MPEKAVYYFGAKKLSIGYCRRPILRDVEIGLEKGQILTLIGPNGAGKSTLLKTIAGQLAPIGGQIFVGDRELAGMSAAERSRSLSAVWTERLRAELMTCGDVVATGRYPYTGRFGILTKRDRRIVEEAMELVRAGDIRDREFAEISDGQRQRVMLARAICQEPRILILDEPTSYLDVRYKLEFLSVLQNLCREKELTVVMSLHELELAARVSDRILCLRGEFVDRSGTPEEIFRRGYLSRLFGIDAGSYDEESCGMELEAPRGRPEVFVIGGGGGAGAIYRRLQRQGRPFAAGILYQNDLDFPAARALAAEVFSAEAFEPVPERLLLAARKRMEECGRVISSREHFGSLDAANADLLAYAAQIGKRPDGCRTAE